MALQNAPVPFPMLPSGVSIGWAQTGSGLGTHPAIVFNAAGDKAAWIFQAQSTTPPDQVSFHVGTVTTAGTVGVIEATLETVNSTGDPSGTPVTNSATGSQTISTVGYKNISGMSGTASLTVGAMYAVVLSAVSSGGWDRNITITLGLGNSPGLANPYASSKDSAGGWSDSITQSSGYPVGFKTSGGTILRYPGLIGAANISASTPQTFSNSTNPDERGNFFTLPYPAKIIGVCVGGSAAGGGITTNDDGAVSLYSSARTTPNQMTSMAIDGEAQGNGFSHIYYFASPVELSANTEYVIAYKAKGTETYSMMMWEYENNAALDWFLGTSFYSATRDGGNPGPDNPGNNFTAGDNKVYAIFPIFSAFDDGAGGGGGLLTHPGMGGGMRG